MADELDQSTIDTATNEVTDTAAAEEAVADEQEVVEVEQIESETELDATPADVAEAESVVESTNEMQTSQDSGSKVPQFRAGDTLRLGVRITEGDKTRIQYFEGIVLARKGAGVSKSFTIRKIGAGGIAVERIFPVNCPSIASYEVRRRGVVRRAKIYFLRDIVGSTANVIKERKIAKEVAQAQEVRAAKKAAKAEKKATKQSTPKAKAATKPTTRSAKRSAKKTS